jgi:hypothetical protein
LAQQEKYLGPVTGWYNQIRAAYWETESFIPVNAHNISKVKLWIDKFGSYGLTSVTVAIYLANVTTHKPTGSALVTGTVLKDDIQSASYGDENHPTTIILDSTLALSAGTEYCIVVYANSGSQDTFLFSGSSGYSGYHFKSANSGSTWLAVSSSDLLFIEYDDTPIIVPPPASIDYPSSDVYGEFDPIWEAVPDASYYDLQQSIDDGENWTTVYSGTNLSWPARVPNGNYIYRVRTHTDDGDSDWTTGETCVVDIPPFTPAVTAEWAIQISTLSGGVP